MVNTLITEIIDIGVLATMYLKDVICIHLKPRWYLYVVEKGKVYWKISRESIEFMKNNKLDFALILVNVEEYYLLDNIKSIEQLSKAKEDDTNYYIKDVDIIADVMLDEIINLIDTIKQDF